MREIKFRVWDNSYNPPKMIYEPTLFESDGEPHDYNGCLSLNEEIQNEIKSGSVFMQYIGLKDKNGKEIYEGDIISDGENIRKIVYINGAFRDKSVYNSSICYEGLGILKIDKIIGNIYENPELLETKDEV